MVRRHSGVAGLEEFHLVSSMHEADVGDGIDEFPRVTGHIVGDRVAPELFRLLELLEDLDDLGHLHRAIRLALGRVAQLADPRVPSAGVIPAIRTLLCQAIAGLIELDGKSRIEPLQHRSEIGRHHPAANQDDIGVFNVGGVGHSFG